MRTLHKVAWYLGTGISAFAATAVTAQVTNDTTPATPDEQTKSSDAHALEEIIVTAQKRAERIQDVPISVNAIGGDTLRHSGVEGLEDLKQVSPSFNYRPSVAGNLAMIRGVGGDFSGPSNESPIAVNFDDVYIASDSGYFYPFFSVERVDVLSGPQGTLFGRNATGGVVNIILRQPSHDFSGQATVGYGNYKTSTGDVYVTGGLSQTLAADFAGSIRRQGDGYGTNLFNGLDVGRYNSDAVRGSISWEPSPETKVRFSADYNRYNGSTFGSHAYYGRANDTVIIAGGPQDENENVQPVAKVEGYGFALHFNQDLGFASLVSISGYRHVDKLSDSDIDGGPLQDLAILNDERNRQFSEELRLDSAGRGPLTWVLGLYYFDYSGGYNPTRITTPLFPLSDINNTLTTKAYAGFAQGTYAVTSTTNLTLGTRYSWEDRTAEGSGIAVTGFPPPGPVVYPRESLREERPTWRVSLDQHFTDDLMAYVSYNRGFKSGGFNAVNLASGGFKSETIDAYEVGLKSELFEHRLRLNSAAYYYKYDNLQVTDTSSGVPVITNAAAATIKGFEAQLSASITRGFTVDAGIAYTHARYDSYPGATCVTFDPSASPATSPTSVLCDAAGRSLLRVPEVAVTLTPRYTFNIGSFTSDTTVSYYYASSQSLYVFSDSPALTRPMRHTLNASTDLGLPGGKVSVTLWANNLTNENQLSYLAVPPITPFSGHGVAAQYLPPRTYGLRLNVKF